MDSNLLAFHYLDWSHWSWVSCF